MPASKSATVQIIPSAQENQRVEVILEEHENQMQVALRYSTWTDGLGWCGQKTIRLDAGQVEELHHTLTAARHRLNRQRAEAGETISAAKVIQFPSLV